MRPPPILVEPPAAIVFRLLLFEISALTVLNTFRPGTRFPTVHQLAAVSNRTTPILSCGGDVSVDRNPSQTKTKSPTAPRRAWILGCGAPPKVELAILPDLSSTRITSTPGLSLKHPSVGAGNSCTVATASVSGTKNVVDVHDREFVERFSPSKLSKHTPVIFGPDVTVIVKVSVGLA